MSCAANDNLQDGSWLLNFLKSYERFRPTAYKPTQSDEWTLGYGHTDGVQEGDTCTMQQALDWLRDDTDEAVAAVKRLVNVPLNQNQFDALVSLTFNAGTAPLRKTLGALLNKGDYAGAAAQFKKWDYQAGKPLPGLENRRVAEAAHFMEAA